MMVDWRTASIAVRLLLATPQIRLAVGARARYSYGLSSLNPRPCPMQIAMASVVAPFLNCSVRPHWLTRSLSCRWARTLRRYLQTR